MQSNTLWNAYWKKDHGVDVIYCRLSNYPRFKNCTLCVTIANSIRHNNKPFLVWSDPVEPGFNPCWYGTTLSRWIEVRIYRYIHLGWGHPRENSQSWTRRKKLHKSPFNATFKCRRNLSRFMAAFQRVRWLVGRDRKVRRVWSLLFRSLGG